MSDSWVVQNLNNALNTWNEKLAEVWELLLMSPQSFKGGGIWKVILQINGAVQAIGLALLVLFFLVGVVKTTASLTEIKRPEHALKLFIRFCIAKGVVTYGLELMLALFTIAQGVMSTMMKASGVAKIGKATLPDKMVKAMAADHGWNMFIVLSGTIENLRIQTLERLLNDLNLSGCNLTWCGIPHPSPSCDMEFKAQNLGFEKGNSNRYLTVCLKNSTRLAHLLKWLHEDRKSAEQMKILVIDDESDQAGVNTRSVDTEERTRINELIINLVGNNDADGDAVDYHFAAMNYIGYTATPYANVLNEAKEESLYPRDFISTLQVSKTYFGPQQIFGDRSSGNYSGLNIVRDIPISEVSLMKEIHKSGCKYSFPEKMEKAICWFLCCVAVKRKDGYKKPLSMLIHTSQITKHHANVNDMVEQWFKNSKG